MRDVGKGFHFHIIPMKRLKKISCIFSFIQNSNSEKKKLNKEYTGSVPEA